MLTEALIFSYSGQVFCSSTPASTRAGMHVSWREECAAAVRRCALRLGGGGAVGRGKVRGGTNLLGGLRAVVHPRCAEHVDLLKGARIAVVRGLSHRLLLSKAVGKG